MILFQERERARVGLRLEWVGGGGTLVLVSCQKDTTTCTPPAFHRIYGKETKCRVYCSGTHLPQYDGTWWIGYYILPFLREKVEKRTDSAERLETNPKHLTNQCRCGYVDVRRYVMIIDSDILGIK